MRKKRMQSPEKCGTGFKKVVLKFDEIFRDYDLVYNDEGKYAAVKNTSFDIKKHYNPILPFEAMSRIVPNPLNRSTLH